MVGDLSSGGISSVKEPLIKENTTAQKTTLFLQPFPIIANVSSKKANVWFAHGSYQADICCRFLLPALGALLFGYEIGATSCAIISIKSPKLSGISWYNLSQWLLVTITPEVESNHC
ncbi:D-xylose-proton symporter-like 1 [Raphanus sativus]|nr:D-xylose-proton symporter-like 1 [Raphanus sativus]